MLRGFLLLAVAGTAVLAGTGCGADAAPPASGDPGAAGSEYGPKMGGPLALSESEQVLVFGTAAAVTRNGLSHLFMIPHRAATPAFQTAYLSIWFPGDWSPGTFDGTTDGLHAKMSFTTLDGRTYDLELGDGSPAGRLQLGITQVVRSMDGSHYYLTGKLQAIVSSRNGRGSSAAANFLINNVP